MLTDAYRLHSKSQVKREQKINMLTMKRGEMEISKKRSTLMVSLLVKRSRFD
jgi:hypothetical protein